VVVVYVQPPSWQKPREAGNDIAELNLVSGEEMTSSILELEGSRGSRTNVELLVVGDRFPPNVNINRRKHLGSPLGRIT